MEKGKIAIFINYIYPEYSGGVSWYVYYLGSHFAKRDFYVDIFTCTKDRNKRKEEHKNNMTVHNLFLDKGNLGLLRFNNRKNYYKEFRGKISKYNVLNIHGVAFIPLREIFKYRRKIIFTCHGSQFREIIYDIRKQYKDFILRPHEFVREVIKALYSYFLEYMTFSFVSEIIVMSEYSKSYITKTYPLINKKKFKVVPIGIDIPEINNEAREKSILRDKYKLDKKKMIFLTLRRLVPRMGIFILINSISKIIKEKPIGDNVYFVLAGKGNLEKEVVKMIDDLGLKDYIRFAGYLNEEQKSDYFKMSDCFILPTEELEGFGIVILESYSHNLPVIGTKVGAIPEIIQHITPDLLIETPRISEFIKKIKYFYMTYKDKRFSFIDVLKEKYNWDVVIIKYIELIKNLR